MKKILRKIAMCILVVVFAVSATLFLRQLKDNQSGTASYENAAEIALRETVPEASTAPAQMTEEIAAENAEETSVWVPVPVENDPQMAEMEKINLAALRQVNSDVVGWIRIPDTKINYPLMQGEDNDFYLNHTWEKEPNSVGSIFLEYQNSPTFSDYNTIAYGHNMNSGAMFAELEYFALSKFQKSHPYVYVVTDAGVYRYEIFAFFQAEVESLTYGMNPQRSDTKQKFLDLALEKSWIDTGVQPQITDRILTLSTCSGSNYDYRYVLQARLPMMEVTQ